MNIYVGNLPIDMTEDELRQIFLFFGEVSSVIMMNDKYIGSGQSRGYGYVEMALKSAGFAAIASLNGKQLRNQPVEVIEARPCSHPGITAESRTTNRCRFNRIRQRKSSSS
jgi:RNA recognition motif-containing protein